LNECIIDLNGWNFDLMVAVNEQSIKTHAAKFWQREWDGVHVNQDLSAIGFPWLSGLDVTDNILVANADEIWFAV
jgi:hypothetical protein